MTNLEHYKNDILSLYGHNYSDLTETISEFIKTFQDGNPLPLGDEKVLPSLILDIFLNCSGGNLAYTAYKIAI